MENITAINKFVELPCIDDGQNDRALWCGGYDDANTTYCSLPGWFALLPVGSLEIQTPQLPLARALVRSFANCRAVRAPSFVLAPRESLR